jgi:hypothetical protein
VLGDSVDIQIASPIDFSLGVLEFDEHVPSIKASIRLEVSGFKYNVLLDTVVWIECAVFDAFVSCLKKKIVATLKDLGEGFELRVDSADGNIYWNISEVDLDGGSVLLKGGRAMSNDEMAFLVNAFEAYPKWW